MSENLNLRFASILSFRVCGLIEAYSYLNYMLADRELVLKYPKPRVSLYSVLTTLNFK
jgi:hypothetical protein